MVALPVHPVNWLIKALSIAPPAFRLDHYGAEPRHCGSCALVSVHGRCRAHTVVAALSVVEHAVPGPKYPGTGVVPSNSTLFAQ